MGPGRAALHSLPQEVACLVSDRTAAISRGVRAAGALPGRAVDAAVAEGAEVQFAPIESGMAVVIVLVSTKNWV
jgi:hypothetical protein